MEIIMSLLWFFGDINNLCSFDLKKQKQTFLFHFLSKIKYR